MDSRQAIAALRTQPPQLAGEDTRPWYRLTKPMALSTPIAVRKPDGTELVLGDAQIDADWLIQWDGRPEHFMEPLNEAAADKVAAHPEIDLPDPIEALAVSGAPIASTTGAPAKPSEPRPKRATKRRKRRAKSPRGSRKAAASPAATPASEDAQ